MPDELCIATVLLASLLTFVGFVLLYRSTGSTTWKASRSVEPLTKTNWVGAILFAVVFSFVANDWVSIALIPFRSSHPDLVGTVALTGMLLVFCSVFFFSIFLDKRTPLRGILAIVFCIITGVFLYGILGVH